MQQQLHSLNGDFCWTLGRAKKEILARFIATHLSCCIAWGEGTILATYWWIFQAQKNLKKERKKQDLTIKLAKFKKRKFHFCHIHQKKIFWIQHFFDFLEFLCLETIDWVFSNSGLQKSKETWLDFSRFLNFGHFEVWVEKRCDFGRFWYLSLEEGGVAFSW